MNESGEPGGESAGDAASRQALHDLLATLAEIDRVHLGADRGIREPADVATGIRFLLHLMGGGLDLAFDADPRRPEFRPTMSAGRRFYGDNPDAIYQSTTIDPTLAYRIRANTTGAVYTSFTVEGGGSLDSRYPPGRVVSSLNDTKLGIASDGSYELIASAEPRSGSSAWLPLAPDACSIVTRHYFEGDASVDRRLAIPIEIEPIEVGESGAHSTAGQGVDDAAVASGIRRVENFVRGLSLDYEKNGPAIDFASREAKSIAGPFFP